MKITPALVFWVLLIIAVFVYCSGCSPAPCWCSDAEGEYESVVEEPQTLFGSHDFFLEGDDKMTSSTLATKCPTCEIYFTHPSYGEHIKTCCP